MISVDTALQILHENIPAPKMERVSISTAHGRRLGEDISAPESSPRYTNSAMDGYAVRWDDCSKAGKDTPVHLRLVGESQAGVPFDGEMASGTAIRISTGAMVPPDADSVVRVEDTKEQEGSVLILSEVKRGQDVRYEGEEFGKGDLLFKKGVVLKARELALLAAVGEAEVPVYSTPQVALIVTGTELAQHDSSNIKKHQIRDSNSIMLASATRESGAVLHSTTHVHDSLEHTIKAVRQAAEGNNSVILCSGGVSVGRHDHVKDAALEVGFKELFWKIKQKPGKPLFASRLGNTLLFGLPGNPVSAFMCFHNYVRPVLAELQGTETIQHSLTAQVEDQISNKGSRTNFIRVKVQDRPNEIARISLAQHQGSHMLSSIVHSDGYVIMEPGKVLEQNDLTEVFLF